MHRCHNCGQELMEIDKRGERLTGCVECNRWSSARSAFIVARLLESGLKGSGSELHYGRRCDGNSTQLPVRTRWGLPASFW